MNKKFTFLFLLFISAVSFYYRVKGITFNHPFWVDEYSTASHANAIIQYSYHFLANPFLLVEPHNFTTHALVALSFKLFGYHEWAARLPFVIAGSTIPVALYLISKRLFDTTTAAVTSLLSSFSYFEIVWSRQARGYILVQLLILLNLYFYFRILQKKSDKIEEFSFFFLVLLGVLTHAFFYVFLISLTIHYIFIHRDKFSAIARNFWTYVALFSIGTIAFQTGFSKSIFNLYKTGLIQSNNAWYYHSFLWREYGLVTFLSISGLLMGFFKSRSSAGLLTLYLLIHIAFISFFFPPYVTRYLLPIFPILIMGMAYALTNTTRLLIGNSHLRQKKLFITIIPVFIALFIISNGYKFVTKPKTFYSINHDFREIALIDYGQVYDVIRKKGELGKQKTAVIDTWNARTDWYIGYSYPGTYIFRWLDEPGLVNGLGKKTDYLINSDSEKVIPNNRSLRLIGELDDLKKAMKKYPKGFIFIDDASLPKDVIDYVEKNFKKELYLDHYPLDDNPYSIWPATLYSWGIK